METITSRSNPLITHIRKLAGDRKYRRASGQMLCEGPKMLGEALAWGLLPQVVLTAEGYDPDLPAETRRIRVPADLLRSVAPTQSPQKVLFLCPIPADPLPERLEGARYLVLDGLQDPGNVGTLWRTADAFGADGLILLPGCADPWGPKTVRATMGACFRLPVWETDFPALAETLARSCLPLYAAALEADTADLRDLSRGRAAVAVGSEGRGVSSAVLAGSDRTVKIPMTDRCESLNAAVAGAVLLWELSRETLGREVGSGEEACL